VRRRIGQAVRQRWFCILNEGRPDGYPVRQPGDPAGEGQDALLGGRILAAMRHRQQDRAHDEA